MDCSICPNQSNCEEANKVDLARIADIQIAVDSYRISEAQELIATFKKALVKRNLIITGRD